MTWDSEFAWSILPLLLEGAKLTVIATLAGSLLAVVLGLALAIARRSGLAVVSAPVRLFISFVRGTPLLVQLYFLFFVLPDIGILLSPLAAGILGLGIHYSTYLAEVYRAGIENVPRDQWEAAKACNLTAGQTWRHVIIPQAVPPMIPAMGNYFVAMFKDTPLLSAVTVLAMMNQAKSIANFNYRYLEPMTLVGAVFLVISLVAALGLTRLELRFGRLDEDR